MIEKLVGATPSGVKATTPISDASRTAPQSKQPAPPSALQNLHIGQHLMARVVDSWPDKNLIQLNLKGQVVFAQSPALHAAGELLELEVVKLGRVPELKVVPPLLRETALQAAARLFLPKQQNPLELLTSLANLKQELPENLSNTKTILSAAEALLTNIPKLQQLTDSKAIANVVKQSGIFYESNLLNTPGINSNLAADSKARLMELIQHFTPQLTGKDNLKKQEKVNLDIVGLGKVAEQAEGALASIVVNQLKSLPEKDNNQSWVIQIPFFSDEELQEIRLTINEESSSSGVEEQNNAWSVSIILNPPNLGKMAVTLRIGSGQLSLNFICEEPITANIVKAYQSTLESRLRAAGLEPIHMAVKTENIEDQKISFSQALIDEEV